MKNVMLALMLCVGVTACVEDPSAQTDDQAAATDETTASQSQAELKVTGHELDPVGHGGATTNSCFAGSDPCVSGWNTCHFECCDGSGGAVASACGNCIGHANDYCQTNGHGGTYYAWWSP